MNACGGGASQSQSVAIVTNSPAMSRIYDGCKNYQLKVAYLSSPLLRLKNIDKSSLLGRACLLIKFQGRLHLPITASWLRTRDFWTHCTCTVGVLCVLNYRCLDIDASIGLLDCNSYYCLHLFVSKELGFMLQAINLQVCMRFYKFIWEFYEFIWQVDASSWPSRS